MANSKLQLKREQLAKFLDNDPDAIRVFEKLFDMVNGGVPVGYVYFQSPHDSLPSDIWPNAIWTNVSDEEANLGRRVVGPISGSWIAGTPAIFSVSVIGGVPTISVVSGGSGYLSGGSGTIPLIVTGTCTTQYVGNATVTNGVITAIPAPGTAGVGYTSGSVMVYDGVYRYADEIQSHYHDFWTSANGAGSVGANGKLINTAGNVNQIEPNDPRTAVRMPATDLVSGQIRKGPETTGPYILIRKWRRTA